MRPILIDTNAYTAFKCANKSIVEIIQHAEVIAMSSVVLGELLSGFDNGSKPKQNRQALQQFLASSRIRLYPVTYDTANFDSQV